MYRLTSAWNAIKGPLGIALGAVGAQYMGFRAAVIPVWAWLQPWMPLVGLIMLLVAFALASGNRTSTNKSPQGGKQN